MNPTVIIGDATLYHADCRDVLREMADNSIDSVVTDPPYALVSIVKRFGKPGSAPAKGDVYARASSGFMGRSWDTGEVAFATEFWAEVLRVLKPGGHVVAFSGTRTYHRMVCAIEDAGFEIRDQLGWLYGSGFPKSHDVSKGIDKIIKRVGMFGPFAEHYAERRTASGLTHNAICAVGGFFAEHNHGGASANWENGHNVPTLEQWKVLQPLLGLSDEFLPLIERVEAEREKVGERKSGDPVAWFAKADRGAGVVDITLPGTAESEQWQGWGTALKPAWEPIVLARKPLIGTVAENVLQWGTGAINVDGCRVQGEDAPEGRSRHGGGLMQGSSFQMPDSVSSMPAGRWPANIVHDGSDEVVAAFPDAPGQQGDLASGNPRPSKTCFGDMAAPLPHKARIETDKSAARFFYCAKAGRKDREEGLNGFEQRRTAAMQGNLVAGQPLAGNGTPIATPVRANTHPTVKPTDLMRWLCRLVTPPGGVVLDPFLGSGSTGKAALLEGFRFIGIEREDEYMPIAAARIGWAAGRMDKDEDAPATTAAPEAPAVAPQQPAANDNEPDLFSAAA